MVLIYLCQTFILIYKIVILHYSQSSFSVLSRDGYFILWSDVKTDKIFKNKPFKAIYYRFSDHIEDTVKTMLDTTILILT